MAGKCNNVAGYGFLLAISVYSYLIIPRNGDLKATPFSKAISATIQLHVIMAGKTDSGAKLQ